MLATERCSAAVRLSRERTGDNSCAKIVSSCWGESVCASPSGSSSTGRKNPKMPGSIAEGDIRTRVGKSNSTGYDRLRISRSAAHRFIQRIEINRAPTNQTTTIATGSQRLPGIGVVDGGAGENDAEMSSTWMAVIARMGADRGSSIFSPAETSSAKGIRNFIEAASHSQYRTRARFFRIAKHAAVIAAANRVDCHR